MTITRWIRVAAAVVAFLTAAALCAGTAGAWQPLSLSVKGTGCGSAVVTGSNPEAQTGTVRGGNLWSAATTIPAHGSITKTVTTSGTYTVTVNYPGDHTLRTASVVVHVTQCPPPTTTTTVAPTTTTTAPSSTTSTVTAPPTTSVTTGVALPPSATPVESEPAFAG